MGRRNMFLLLGLFGLGSATHAHHSFTATYDESTAIEIEGTLVQLMFRNPHSFVHVLVPDERGEMRRWAVEWGGAGVLDRQGITRETLRVGDHVVITGNPGRNAIDHRLRMQTLRRSSDDFVWGLSAGETFD